MLNETLNKKEKIVFGDDSIAIVKYIAGLPGGRTLTLTDEYKAEHKYIPAGTPIYKVSNDYNVATMSDGDVELVGPTNNTPTSNEGGYYAPAISGVPEGGFDQSSAGVVKVVGLLYRSISVSDPQAAIMTMGVVNETVLANNGITITDDIKAALPAITFVSDIEA